VEAIRLFAVFALIILEIVSFGFGLNEGFFNQEYDKATFYIALSVAFQISITQTFTNDDIKEIKEKIEKMRDEVRDLK